MFWRFSVALAQQSRPALTFTTSRSAAFACFTLVRAAVRSHKSQNESSVKPCPVHQFLATPCSGESLREFEALRSKHQRGRETQKGLSGQTIQVIENRLFVRNQLGDKITGLRDEFRDEVTGIRMGLKDIHQKIDSNYLSLVTKAGSNFRNPITKSTTTKVASSLRSTTM